MKIVYTVATYYPNKDGVQSVTQKQAEALARAGHEVVVICGNKRENCAEEIHNNVKILRVNAYNKFIFPCGDRKDFLILVERECKNADVLITVCIPSFATTWILDMLHELQCCKILYLHGIADFNHLSLRKLGIVYYFYRMNKQIYWKLYYAFQWKKVKEYNAVVHIHEEDGSLAYVSKRGYENNYIIYNMIEDDMFKIGDCTDNEKYFIDVANYSTNKNQKMLLKYYYRADVPCGLIMIGSDDNAYYRDLIKYKEKLERKYGTRDVKLLHHIERYETVQYIKNALAVVITSKTEQFPLTILEAMAAGKPFISSNVGVVPYLPGGIIFHNSGELIKALQKLAGDRNYGAMLGKEGNTYAREHLTMECHMEKINAVLRVVTQEASNEKNKRVYKKISGHTSTAN